MKVRQQREQQKQEQDNCGQSQAQLAFADPQRIQRERFTRGSYGSGGGWIISPAGKD